MGNGQELCPRHTIQYTARSANVSFKLPMRSLIALLALMTGALPVEAAANSAATEVIVLGVDHTAQLVNSRQQPAALRAFMSKLAPAAVCIERSPERFARGDHYEFTYEIQHVIVPWAHEHGAPLHPFDWLPEAEDSMLAFGIDDLERPPLLRRASGFQGFLTFPDPSSRTSGLFFADEEQERARYRRFYAAYPDELRGDFARRLFLYRTFLQARRIAHAAERHRGQRLLVVVGVMHKDDIERILGTDAAIRIVQPSAVAAEPTPEEISRHQRPEDLFAIATFNLLGAQSRTGAIDVAWLEEVVQELKRLRPGVETDLLATRLAELKRSIEPAAALRAYSRLIETAGDRTFTWNGVKDAARIDSFFDPFGNLTVSQRARVEAARLHHAAKRTAKAEAIRSELRQELSTPLKQAQLDGYWPMYVAPQSSERR